MDNKALVLDFLEWLGTNARPYPDVMAAWRTSCPRLTIWEDAVDASLVQVRQGKVSVTADGRAFLRSSRREHLRSHAC